MAGQDYLIPFGIEPSKFFEGLNAMDEGTDKLAAAVTDTNKKVQESFDKAAGAGNALGKTLDRNAEKAKGLRDQAKGLGKDLNDALNGNNIGKGFEEKVQKFRKLLDDTLVKKGVKIKFDIDAAKLGEFERQIVEAANEAKTLIQVVDAAKVKLGAMDPTSPEWAELSAQIETADEFLKRIIATNDELIPKNKSLKRELAELKNELAAMEEAGEDNTQQFLDMAVRAGELEDQIGDTAARIRVLASDTKYLDAGIQAVGALAGAFTTAQGAIALFGAENEAAQEIIQKVTGAMAVRQGVQAVPAALQKEIALMVLFFSKSQAEATRTCCALTTAEVANTGATVAATTATKSWSAALLANPIFLVVAAVGLLVTALVAFASGSDEAEEAADNLNDTLERQNQLLKLDEGSINRRYSVLIAQAKAQGKLGSDITTLEGKQLAERTNLRIETLNELRRLQAEENYVRKLGAEEFKKLNQQEMDLTIEVDNLNTELEVKRIERESQRRQESKEADKERDARTKEDIAKAKQRAEELRQIQDQEIKFAREYRKEIIEATGNRYNKERQEAMEAATNRIEDLQREKSLSAKAERDKNELITAIRLGLQDKLAEIDRQESADRATIQFQAQKMLAELSEEGAERELEVVRLSYAERRKEIEEQFKDQVALRDRLIKALGAEQIRAEKKSQNQAAQDSLKQQEERAVLEVETAAKFIGDLPGIEEAKQVEVLKVKIDFAQRSLDLLLAQGNAENSVVVLQAKKQIQDLQKALGGATKDLENATNKDFTMFDLLGLGDLTDEQRKAVEQAARQMLDSVREITSFIVDQYQRQIDKRQEVIDQETKDIERLEKQLEEEKELRDQGLANNVETIQAELDEKKRQREEDIKQQEELQRRQAGIQRAQLALDTATQASGLITSAANIFKSLSNIPFVGIPLAIATVGLMIGSFVTAKVKAFQAISDGQKQSFGGGGWVDGKPHTQGGKKYRAVDGSGDVVELESGEHVTKKTQAQEYADLLDAVNEDRLAGMSEDALRAMLQELGIHLSEENPMEGIQIVRERDAYILEADSGPQDVTAEVRDIARDVAYLAEKERHRPKRWDDDDFYYTERGNKTTRTPKK